MMFDPCNPGFGAHSLPPASIPWCKLLYGCRDLPIALRFLPWPPNLYESLAGSLPRYAAQVRQV